MPIKRADTFSIVSVTVANPKQAQKLSSLLLNMKLCACVHIVPKITSMYWWKNKIQKSTESWMVIKTHQTRVKKLMQEIQKHHSYDVPEILEIKLYQGSSSYLDWVKNSVGM
jgi:periplasmic divalent cation tolerance protein